MGDRLMGAVSASGAPAGRSEREVAADTLWRLLVEGLVRDRATATAAVGLTFPDLEAARARHKRRGFVPPAGRPPDATNSAATIEPVTRFDAAARHTERYQRAHTAPGKRRCAGCEEEKPETDFPWKDKAKGYRHSRCSSCRNRKARTRYLDVKKTKMLNEVGLTFIVGEADELGSLCCVDCGNPIRVGDEVHGRAALRHTTCP